MHIKVGLLFSFTGTTSITEKGQYDAACFAISQYNKEEHTIEVVTRDICSDPRKAVTEAEALAREGVKVFIGCYTSACRKAVLPVLEKYNCLLVYPTLYEGQEDHPNVFYTGEVPNQQVHTLIDYLMNQYGKRIYLIGNDYIYPRETNAQVKTYINEKKGEVVEEKYVPFGHREFHQTIQDIILKKPDAIFSTLVGQSVLAFYQTYKQMGLNPEATPIFSPITKETELYAMGTTIGAGHYSSASYFQSLNNPMNKAFVKEYDQFFGERKAISSVMFNTYLGTKILLDAIIKKNSFARDKIFHYMSGKKMETACGTLRIGTKKRHLSRPVKIGKALPNGQFEIVWDSASNIQPRPYRIKQSKKSHVNEIVLNAWGQISEEAIIAISEHRTIQYMSRKAIEMTGFNKGETITPKMLKQIEKTYQVNSYEAKMKTLFLLKPSFEKNFESIYQFGSIQTKNQLFQTELETATIASQSTANVLILGETGTGKEVLARSIHEESDRKDGPFIAINTGAIPKDLITSELFGYVEGTFTGAKKGGSIGRFESAHNGTLFLDEIGDMPLELQVILLRAIETKKIIRLGESKEREVDIRIIAATNRDLEEEIAYNNGFRSDLYYRLNVLSIDIPPLRERPEDVEALAWKFMNEFHEIYGDGPKEVDQEVMQLFIEYPWPGNIRELRNIIERAFLLARGKSSNILSEHLPKKIKGYYNRKMPSELSLKDVEKKMITQAILETNNVNEASKKLGIGRSTLYRKMKEFEISL
ncbi:transporter substrate-binding protein [Pseudogracilibacillus auburnensis]|uniref:transporter substrate-binding protein n=1 Tax=Pseudogracilibacillus auburnensis TaxID=1494959 RepID=UPI001A97550B|nr:transporter substrate-binding protein [Pseudogracilibacillus auburnensis]MBO1004239.1 transporter substrate-binding protein [Pseudogracilibacillus auburnensis]